ncbi:MAG: leucine-rich repeat domain-containing protein, partial [Clostridia bacterium]
LAGDEEGKLGTWAIGSAMEFADETEPIVITLTIVNNSDERSLSFELSGQAYSAFNGTNLGDTNIDRTCVYSINNATPITNATYTSGAINVEALKTATIIMTLEISDNGKSVTAFNNGFSATLRNVGESTENFSFSPTTKTITLNTEEPLTEENLPEMVVEGEPAYYGLYQDQDYTQKIQLPYSGANILYAKFANPTNLTFTSISSDTAYSVSKNSSNLPTGSLEIPERYNGKTVSTVPSYAFSGCTELTNISIPDSIFNIGYNAFVSTAWYDNQSDGLVYAGKVVYNFKGTMIDNLSITLLADTKGIASEAFYNCDKLINILIPNDVVFIGSAAFSGCTGLTTLTIPNKITKIQFFTFFNCLNLTSITIPDGVTSIGEDSFWNCLKLTGLTIPDSVTDIGKEAFRNCDGLTSITLPVGLTTIENKVFYSCSELTNITIPNNLTTIKTEAFSGCSKITNITIPESIIKIDESAFNYCTNLNSITFPNSNFSIGDNAFANTEWFNNKGTGVVYAGKIAYRMKGISQSVTIESGTIAINSNCFLRNKYLKYITIPSSVECIGEDAFNSCVELVSVTMSTSNLIIENGAFKYCRKLTSINFPSGLTQIATGAFSFCLTLANITIPESVTSIGDGAFSQCLALESINIPRNLSSLGTGAFVECINLNQIVVDEENDYYKDIDGILYNKNETELIFCPLNWQGEINISKDVNIINYQAKSQRVTSYNVDANNSIYKSVDGVVFSKDGTELISYPFGKSGIFYIPDTTIKICEDAFGVSYHAWWVEIVSDSSYAVHMQNVSLECSITELHIPNSIQEISISNGFYLNGVENLFLDVDLTSVTGTSFDSFISDIQTVYFLDSLSLNLGSELFQEFEFSVPDGMCDNCGQDESAHHEYYDSPDGYCDICGQDEFAHHSFNDLGDGTCTECGQDESSHITDHSYVDEIGDGWCDQCNNDESSHQCNTFVDESGNSEYHYRYFEPVTTDRTGYTKWTKVTNEYSAW